MDELYQLPDRWELNKNNYGLMPKSIRFYTGGLIEMFLIQPLFFAIVAIELQMYGIINIEFISDFVSEYTFFN